MRVLKVVAEGFTTSFRYPHFLIGVQPTYEMPPPATLYGHIASVLGEWFDPEGVEFAVRFTYIKKQADIETTILLTPTSGKMPQDHALPKVIEGNANPFNREILFFPRMTLYINRPDWESAFQQPRYTVCLGRSQDLITYRSVTVIEVDSAEIYYLEHTLLPYTFASYTAAGQSVLMPRFVDNRQRRFPAFDRYVVLHRRIHSRMFIRYAGQPPLEPCWVDSTEPVIDGDPCGIVFLRWIP